METKSVFWRILGLLFILWLAFLGLYNFTKNWKEYESMPPDSDLFSLPVVSSTLLMCRQAAELITPAIFAPNTDPLRPKYLSPYYNLDKAGRTAPPRAMQMAPEFKPNFLAKCSAAYYNRDSGTTTGYTCSNLGGATFEGEEAAYSVRLEFNSQGRLIKEEYCMGNGIRCIEKKYYDNKQLKLEITWFDQQRDGPARWYYPNGGLKTEANYINGVFDGWVYWYYDNGVLKAAEFFKHGKIYNTGKYYYENGNLESELAFVDGLKQGLNRRYYQNGALKDTVTYKNGKVEGNSKLYYENGQLKCISPYIEDQKKGRTVSFYPDGQIESIINYVGDKLNGRAIWYFQDGMLDMEADFQEGKIEGMRRDYYKSGKLKGQINYVDGRRHGQAIYYNEDGSIREKKVFPLSPQ